MCRKTLGAGQWDGCLELEYLSGTREVTAREKRHASRAIFIHDAQA